MQNVVCNYLGTKCLFELRTPSNEMLGENYTERAFYTLHRGEMEEIKGRYCSAVAKKEERCVHSLE
jgi:spore coat polysaccharide biosynthesis protein SpsF (cytidylyltransferase family)